MKFLTGDVTGAAAMEALRRRWRRGRVKKPAYPNHPDLFIKLTHVHESDDWALG